jgi:chorismate synthase
MGNTSGQIFRVTTFGESHGSALGAVIDGCPPNIAISTSKIQEELDRRRPGQSALTSSRKERDQVHILSGIFEGRTTGTPICLGFFNEDARSKDYSGVKDLYRPGHADYAYEVRFGIRDHRGGGRASARETVARVAAGAVAKQWLSERYNIEVVAWVDTVKDIQAQCEPVMITRAMVDQHPTRCPDQAAALRMTRAIEGAQADGDTLGGTVAVVARNVPAGWGAPVFDKLEADLGKACLSLPACKGFEIGSGFAGTRMMGSEHNDPFVMVQGEARPASNHAGGVLGGISTGAPLLARCAFKPVSTHFQPQRTVTKDGEEVVFVNEGRHDPCVLPRAVPLVEAAVWLTLADHAVRTAALCRA